MIREILRSTDGYVHIPVPKEYLNQELEVIVFKTDEGSSSVVKNRNLLDEFDEISQNIPVFDRNIDLTKADEDMNCDIF